MSALIIPFRPVAEPPVDLSETLEAAARRHALALLAEVFGFSFADELAALAEIDDPAEQAAIIARLEALS